MSATIPPLMLLLQVADRQNPDLTFWPFVIFAIVKMLVIFTVYMVGVALLTLAERKVSAWIQDRHGPNRVGKGWLQPAADGLKNFMKEETLPATSNKALFILAPMLAFVPALVTFAVVPFAAPIPTRWGLVGMQLADLPIGFLFTLAIGSLGVYGIVLAGWSSNNKYALLGGLRSSAQLISYEIALGMSTIPVLLLAGNVTLGAIVTQQQAMGWNALTLTIAFFTFVVAGFAETNRLPFDLPEAETELVAGFHTEYSGMKFSMFFIAEYANMVTMSALMATMFLGGWDIPFTTWDNVAPWSWVKTLVTLASFGIKLLFFLFLFMWVRWTIPRFRYDQLMSLGWKFMLPLALAYIVVIAGATLAFDAMGLVRGGLPYTLALLALNVLLIVLIFFVIDRGRILSPAYSRLELERVQRLRGVAAARTAREQGNRAPLHGEPVVNVTGD